MSQKYRCTFVALLLLQLESLLCAQAIGEKSTMGDYLILCKALEKLIDIFKATNSALPKPLCKDRFLLSPDFISCLRAIQE